MTANQGGLSSKNFPQNFERYADCTWLIQVDPNYTVKLEFAEFDVPKVNNSCENQYVAVRLVIQNNSGDIWQKCVGLGRLLPKQQDTPCQALWRWTATNYKFNYKRSHSANGDSKFRCLKGVHSKIQDCMAIDTNRNEWLFFHIF